MVIRRTSLIALPLLVALTVFLIGTANGTARRVNAQTGATLALDMDPTNGNGPCDPIDDTRSVNAGDTFEIAMCLTDAITTPKDFDIRVIYDDGLDQCVPVDCPAGIGCLDTNPDANAGATTWTSPSLGDDCDCSIGGELPPVCDQDPGTGPGKGQTLLFCNCMPPATLSVGEGTSAPLGMITFKNVQPGTDHITFGPSSVSDSGFMVIADCDETQCFGGTLETLLSLTPTPIEGTPTTAATPGAETTPGGEAATPEPGAATAAAATAVAQGTSIAAINQAATATSAAAATKTAKTTKTPTSKATAKATAKPGSTSEEGGGSSGPSPFLIAGIVVVAVAVVGGGGWFGYRRFLANR